MKKVVIFVCLTPLDFSNAKDSCLAFRNRTIVKVSKGVEWINMCLFTPNYAHIGETEGLKITRIMTKYHYGMIIFYKINVFVFLDNLKALSHHSRAFEIVLFTSIWA